MALEDKNPYMVEYHKLRKMLKSFEQSGSTKNINRTRMSLDQIWNQLRPDQQKTIAEKYMSEY